MSTGVTSLFVVVVVLALIHMSTAMPAKPAQPGSGEQTGSRVVRAAGCTATLRSIPTTSAELIAELEGVKYYVVEIHPAITSASGISASVPFISTSSYGEAATVRYMYGLQPAKGYTGPVGKLTLEAAKGYTIDDDDFISIGCTSELQLSGSAATSYAEYGP